MFQPHPHLDVIVVAACCKNAALVAREPMNSAGKTGRRQSSGLNSGQSALNSWSQTV